MHSYQHLRDGRPLKRFTFECVESCHKGTDIASALKRGEVVAVDPRSLRLRDAEGQLELAGVPASIKRKR